MEERSSTRFSAFLASRAIRLEIVLTVFLTVLISLFLLWVYPFPNTYADTGAYISVAETGKIGNFRPPGYSWFMAGAHFITPNPDGLVILQTVLYFASSLFLYLTARYFFNRGSRLAWRIFYFCLLLSPLSVYLCNFVISDSLFISLTNLWIASILWIVGTRKVAAVHWNTLLLLLLLQVRYIALFYPLITVLSLFAAYFKGAKLRFFLLSALQTAVFAGVILFTTYETGKNIGVPVFSGFSGWQKANNAMHIVPHLKLDPKNIQDPEIRKVHAFMVTHTPPSLYPAPDSVVVTYLWSPFTAPKKLMYRIWGNGTQPYLHYWHKTSIPLGRWGDYIIQSHPGLFLKHYIRPNFLFLFKMSNEALFIWPPPSKQMTEWFGCRNCAVAPRYSFFHDFLAATASRSFNILWCLFVLSLIALLFRSKLGCSREQYNMLLLVSFFCATYVVMSVYASPIVLRYLLVIRHSLVLLPFLIIIHLFPARKQ